MLNSKLINKCIFYNTPNINAAAAVLTAVCVSEKKQQLYSLLLYWI